MSNREHKRQKLTLSVNLFFNGETAECKVLDISVGGAKILAPKHFEKGTEMELRMPNFGDFRCKVAWRDQDYHGLQFLGDKAEIAEILAALALYA